MTVEAGHGRITLRGIVLNAEEQAHTEDVATVVPGVLGVDNQLRVMTKASGPPWPPLGSDALDDRARRG